MGIYFGNGIYGIKCVNLINNKILYEKINHIPLSGEEVNMHLQMIKNLLTVINDEKQIEIYFCKQYSTTYELNSENENIWVKANIELTHNTY